MKSSMCVCLIWKGVNDYLWVRSTKFDSVKINFLMLVNSFLSQASTEAECRIPALTGSERNSWARVRREHFTSGINKNSLQAIEEALFLVRQFYHIIE